jgi:D-alanine transfer protein
VNIINASDVVTVRSDMQPLTVDRPTRGSALPFVNSLGDKRESRTRLAKTTGLPHISAGLIAILVAAAAVLAGTRYAEGVERLYVHAMAPVIFEQKSWGTVLQRAALQEPDLLMLYGGSELRKGGSYRAGMLFQAYPTGFNVFSVGLHGEDSIIMLQQLAANGDLLRGKKIAIFLTPYLFLQPKPPPPWYLFNFSDLNASAFLFESGVDDSIKQSAAAQMLSYPKTLKNDPLLHFALEELTNESPLGRLLFQIMVPLGRIHLWILMTQDHYAILQYIWDHPEIKPDIQRKAAALDWSALVDQATAVYAQRAGNNPWGIDSAYWNENLPAITNQKGDLPDSLFYRLMQNSEEWRDMDILLRELHELGAQVLVLTVPLHGRYYDYRGTSSQARAFYYEKLRSVARPYGASVVAFEDHEYDKYFLEDTFDHPTPRGWVYYDKVLDDFFHNRIP